VELSDNLLCLFNAGVKERDGSYIIEVPQREINIGDVETGAVYRIAMAPSGSQTTSDTASTPERSRQDEQSAPPVEEGDVVDVEVEDIGEQGDGIARVGPGYVVIVPETDVGERVAVEITEARENVAFAEVVDRYDR